MGSAVRQFLHCTLQHGAACVWWFRQGERGRSRFLKHVTAPSVCISCPAPPKHGWVLCPMESCTSLLLCSCLFCEVTQQLSLRSRWYPQLPPALPLPWSTWTKHSQQKNVLSWRRRPVRCSFSSHSCKVLQIQNHTKPKVLQSGGHTVLTLQQKTSLADLVDFLLLLSCGWSMLELLQSVKASPQAVGKVVEMIDKIIGKELDIPKSQPESEGFITPPTARETKEGLRVQCPFQKQEQPSYSVATPLWKVTIPNTQVGDTCSRSLWHIEGMWRGRVEEDLGWIWKFGSCHAASTAWGICGAWTGVCNFSRFPISAITKLCSRACPFSRQEREGQPESEPPRTSIIISKISKELTKANQNRSETKFYITFSEFNTQDSEGETFVTTSSQLFPTVGDGRNPINPVSHPLNMGFSMNPCSSGCKGQAFLHAVLKQKCGQCGRAWDNSTRYSRISAIHACEMHV